MAFQSKRDTNLEFTPDFVEFLLKNLELWGIQVGPW